MLPERARGNERAGTGEQNEGRREAGACGGIRTGLTATFLIVTRSDRKRGSPLPSCRKATRPSLLG